MMFELSVAASNKGSSSSAKTNVFVSRRSVLVGSGAGEMRLSPSGDSLTYISTPVAPSDRTFRGFGVRFNSQGNDWEALSPNLTFQLDLSDDLSMVAYVVPQAFNMIRVHYTDLVTDITTIIPNTPFFQRGPQYLEPDFSSDKTLLTYQVWHPDVLLPPSQGGVDTFAVSIWDLATLTEKRVAVQGTNFHPTFSSDGNHLVYMSDRSGTGGFELYALPVVGGTVPVDSSTTPTPLTDTGGSMGDSNPPANQPKAWNPNLADPILATREVAGKLHLVPTDGTGSVLVNAPGSAQEFVWSPSGQDLMMSTGNELYRVSKTGNAELVYQSTTGDNFSRLSWSGDETFLLYNAKRLNDTWYELIDLNGSLGISEPLRVTSASPPGESGTYANFMSIRPVWSRTGSTAYVLFFDSGPTPNISTMDFGGLSP
jgi:hypothetical protein